MIHNARDALSDRERPTKRRRKRKRRAPRRAARWLGALAFVLAGGAVAMQLDWRRDPRPTAEGELAATIASRAVLGPSLPPSERVFVVGAPSGARLLLGAHEKELWAVAVEGLRARERWRARGAGAAQLVTAGDYGRGHKLYVARGRVAAADAPLALSEIDPTSGTESELWRHQGPRNEAVHLSIADVDGDGQPELAFAYFTTTHEVRTRHLEADGTPIEGEPMRMANARAYADMDGDGTVDEIIGRAYGDASDEKGHIRVRLKDGWVHVPTDRGVRTLEAVVAPGGATLYFADGWASSYGREARAQLKRARLVKGVFEVETLAGSPTEFTFFALAPFQAGRAAVAAAGSSRVTVFVEPRESSSGEWSAVPLAEQETQSIAVMPIDERCAWVFIPTKSATRAELVCPRFL